MNCLWSMKNSWVASALTRAQKCPNRIRGGEIRLQPPGEDAALPLPQWSDFDFLKHGFPKHGPFLSEAKNLKTSKIQLY